MRSVLKLSPAIIVQDGRIMFEKNWKVTDLSRQNVEPTPFADREVDAPVAFVEDGEVVNNGEPVLITTIWMDENEKRIEESENERIEIRFIVNNITQNKEVNIKLKHEDSETGDISYTITKGIVNTDGTITLKK